MLGHHRRKISPNQVPRDQFGRLPNKFTISNGYFLSNASTVADSDGFVSKPVYISHERRTAIHQQKMEDFMDAEDFDNAGRSQIQLAKPKLYKDNETNKVFGYTEDAVNILKGLGFTLLDLYEDNSTIRFSHMSENLGCECSFSTTDWIEVKQGQSIGKKREWIAPPNNFNQETKIKLKELGNSMMNDNNDDVSEFSIDAMFHLEGEGEMAKEIFGGKEKKTIVPWKPEKILKQRFSVDT